MTHKLAIKTRKRQLDFFNNRSPYAALRQLGGSKMISHPKRKRPISTKHEMHLVMSSKVARGENSMRANKNIKKVKEFVYNIAKRNNVSIIRFENMGNHLHILIKVKFHESYNRFVRGISAAISRLISGAKRGQAKTDKTLFWSGRPFTRIVTWGKDRLGLLKYLNSNRIQAVGFEVFVKEHEEGYRLTG